MIFGKNRDKGIRLTREFQPEVVKLGDTGVTPDDLLVHDEKSPNPTLAFLLSRFRYPNLPEPIGVFRQIEAPAYEQLVEEQIQRVIEKEGKPDLKALLTGGDTWTIE